MRAGISALWEGRIAKALASLNRLTRVIHTTEIAAREAAYMKQKRAWVTANALEVAMLALGGSFVIVASVLASFVGLN